MELGRLDFCMRVSNVRVSRAFYEKLGFDQVEGDDEEGWAVVVQGSQRLGLFEPRFMQQPFSLNFRGGDVISNAARLQQLGVTPESGPTRGKSGGASAVFRDPDGHMIFLDTALDEAEG